MPPRLPTHALNALVRRPQHRYAHTPLFQTVTEAKKESKKPWIPVLGFIGGCCLAYGLMREVINSNSNLPFLSNKSQLSASIEGNVKDFARQKRRDPRFAEMDAYVDFTKDKITEHFVGGTCGDGNVVGYQAWWKRGNTSVVGLVYLGRRTAGIPTVVHGGLIHSLIQEAVQRNGIVSSGWYGDVKEVKVDYKNPTRVQQFVQIEAIVSGVDERGMTVDVTFTADEDGKLLAKGRGLFVPDEDGPSVAVVSRQAKEERARAAEAKAAGVPVFKPVPEGFPPVVQIPGRKDNS